MNLKQATSLTSIDCDKKEEGNYLANSKAHVSVVEQNVGQVGDEESVNSTRSTWEVFL